MTEPSTIIKILEIAGGGLIGAIAAYCFNLFHWKTTEKIRKIENLCEEINKVTEKLEQDTIQYWLSPPPQNDAEAIIAKQLEISIKSLMRTQVFLTQKLSDFIQDNKKQITLAKAKTLNNRLFELSTGEDFESKARKARPSRCNNISRACADIRFNLSEITT